MLIKIILPFSFSFSKTYLYKFINKLDMSKESHQLLLIYILESILNSEYDIEIPDIARKISEALVLSGINIELYKRGSKYLFYPSGAENLDTKLVNNNLNWLGVSQSQRKNAFGIIVATTKLATQTNYR